MTYENLASQGDLFDSLFRRCEFVRLDKNTLVGTVIMNVASLVLSFLEIIVSQFTVYFIEIIKHLILNII